MFLMMWGGTEVCEKMAPIGGQREGVGAGGEWGSDCRLNDTRCVGR